MAALGPQHTRSSERACVSAARAWVAALAGVSGQVTRLRGPPAAQRQAASAERVEARRSTGSRAQAAASCKAAASALPLPTPRLLRRARGRDRCHPAGFICI